MVQQQKVVKTDGLHELLRGAIVTMQKVYTCNICGVDRKDANHWFVVSTSLLDRFVEQRTEQPTQSTPRCGGEMREDDESQIFLKNLDTNRRYGGGRTFSVNHGGM
jgi:hypothetical protein